MWIFWIFVPHTNVFHIADDGRRIREHFNRCFFSSSFSANKIRHLIDINDFAATAHNGLRDAYTILNEQKHFNQMISFSFHRVFCALVIHLLICISGLRSHRTITRTFRIIALNHTIYRTHISQRICCDEYAKRTTLILFRISFTWSYEIDEFSTK